MSATAIANIIITINAGKREILQKYLIYRKYQHTVAILCEKNALADKFIIV